MKVAGGWQIARRYFVMNGFDGILSVLGIILGTYALGTTDPKLILAPGLGATIAIAISGFWIAYLTEEAEQVREIHELERTIFTDLDDSMYVRAAKVASVVNSLVDGASPFIFGMLILSPFLFVESLGLPMDIAYYLSFVISGVLLFVLGTFLGRLSKQNMIIFGIKTCMAGVVITIIILFLGVH